MKQRPGHLFRTARLYSQHARGAVRAKWYLRRADIGPRVRVAGRPSIRPHGDLRVENRVQLYSTLATLELVVRPGARMSIGARSLINFGTSVVAYESVSIGEDCHIGPHCMIMDNSFHEMDPDRRLEVPPSKPVVIEDNVWLGARVIVTPGVTIGRDAVIGAGSVVTADVAPRTFAAGVPARTVTTL